MLKHSYLMAGLLMLAAGCSELAPTTALPASSTQKPGDSKPAAAPAPAAKPSPAAAESETAVEQALQWAQRCDQANQKAAKLETEKAELARKNQELADHLSKAKQDNEQLNRELTDANNMLVELRKELDRWRANVLGFRQEMREAQQTQLEALAKIMKMLGGEMALPPSSGPAAGAAQPRSNAAAEPASRPSESGAPQP